MKKIIMLCLLFVVCCSFALAIEGDVTVYSFKVYEAESGSVLDSSWSDDTFSMTIGKTMEVQLRYTNPYNESITIHSDATLYNIKGSDLDRTNDITVDKNTNSRSIVFEYFIPTDMSRISNDLEITYSYTLANGTAFSHDQIFSVQFTGETIDSDTAMLNITRTMANSQDTQTNLYYALTNLSQSMLDLNWHSNDILSAMVTNCTNWATTCNTALDAEKTRSGSLDTQLATCNGQKNAMFTQSQMDEAKSKARSEQSGSDTTTGLILVGIAVIIYLFDKQKKNKMSGEGGSLNQNFKPTGFSIFNKN